MNVVTLIGDLATEVQVRQVGEKKVAGFLLAVQRPGKDEADFVWVSAWERQAEVCEQYLAKGGRVAVDGRLRSRSWDEDGKRRTKIEVVANRVQFLSPRPELGEVVPWFPGVQAAAMVSAWWRRRWLSRRAPSAGSSGSASGTRRGRPVTRSAPNFPTARRPCSS